MSYRISLSSIAVSLFATSLALAQDAPSPRINPLLGLLDQDKGVFAQWVNYIGAGSDPQSAISQASSGFDFVIYDMEHSGFDISKFQNYLHGHPPAGAILDTGKTMKIYEERTIAGDISDVWRIATDVAKWPDWDPHEEAGEIHGPFRAGTTAMSKPRGGPVARWTLTRVDPLHAWALVNPMPIGKLEVECCYEALPGNCVRCEKTMQVSGWILRLLFWLHFEKATRHDMQSTWIALEGRCKELSAELT